MLARLALVLTVALASLVLSVSSASAAVSVRADGTSVLIDQATGPNNTVIGYDAPTDKLTVTNIDGATVGAPDGGCTQDGSSKVVCPPLGDLQAELNDENDGFFFSGGCVTTATIDLGDGTNEYHGEACGDPSTINVTGGGGRDTFRGSDNALDVTVDNFNGGAGDDDLEGGSSNDVLHGDAGQDRLYGDDGNDQVFGDDGDDEPDGGAGNDLLDGGPGNDGLERSQGTSNDPGVGADTYLGGPGSDTLLLENHAQGVAISLNGAADDGSAGEGDNVGADIEEIDGTDGNDSFTGSAGNDGFYGRLGNDTIHGAGGDDDLRGAGGDDSLFGDAGNDKLEGSTGADSVDGGPGSDLMYGDQANCVGAFICTPDPDTLLARDGERDTVDCGGGADTADVDSLDVVAYCATVRRVTVDPPPPPPPPGCVPPNPACPAKTTFSFTTSGKRSRAKGIAVKVTCSAKCTFVVKLEIAAKVARKAKLGRKALTIGTAKGSLAAAGSKTVTVKLSAKARGKLKRLKTVAGTLKVAAKDEGGATTNLKKGVKTVR